MLRKNTNCGKKWKESSGDNLKIKYKKQVNTVIKMFRLALLRFFFTKTCYITTNTPQPFYGPFSGASRVSRCQKRTSGLCGARED